MGTCYSSKSKSASHPYTTVPMATSSQEDAHRALRPTPYTRGGIGAGGGSSSGSSSLQRCIPLPTKYRNLQPSSDKFSGSKLDGQPKSSTLGRQIDATVAENNANNNLIDSNDVSKCSLSGEHVPRESERNPPPVPKQDDGLIISKGSPVNIDQMKVQYGMTRIPTKVMAQLSGLPKPQMAVITSRAPLATKGTLSACHNQVSNLNDEKKSAQRVSPDKESMSDKSHSGDSSSTDYDSGIGQSLSDQLGGTKSKEGPQLEFPDKPNPSVGERRTIFSSPGVREPVRDRSSAETAAYGQPGSYAAYRGVLSYRHISPLKKMPELSQWRKTGEPKEARTGSGPHRPVIAKGILSRGARAALSVESVKEEPTPNSAQSTTDNSPSSPLSDNKGGSPQLDSYVSPASDIENRGFLIDDDISDQPGLIALERSKPTVPSVKKSVCELHALQNSSGRHGRFDRPLHERHSVSSDVGSSCSSLASDDLMLDFERSIDTVVEDAREILSSPKAKPHKTSTPARRLSYGAPAQQNEKRNSWGSNTSDEGNSSLRRASELPRWVGRTATSFLPTDGGRSRTASLPLRPPRQLVLQECDDGGVKLDASSHRSVCQDLNSVKTMLLRLRRVLQDAETLNPFEQTNSKNIFYQVLAQTDLPAGFASTPTGETPANRPVDLNDVMQENIDLKRQLVLMQQQLEDRNCTIHLLQQQMTKYMKIANAEKEVGSSNAAVQTDRL